MASLAVRSANRLADRGREDGAEGGGCDDQGAGRPFFEREDAHPPGEAAGGDSGKRISNAPADAARAPMVLGQRP